MKDIYIKNMVCDRCIQSVKDIFIKNGIQPIHVQLGEVQVAESLDSSEMNAIDIELRKLGFEIIDVRIPVLVLKIKSALIEYYSQEYIPEEFKISTYLTDKFPYDYSHLSRVFSQHEKNTVEHYVIKLRIEKAKEILSYQEYNISEVAFRLGYASAAHFSRQFKAHVGLSPSKYKNDPLNRNSLNNI